MTTDKIAYTVTEAAAAVSVSRPTMYRWIKMGCPTAVIGGCTRIPVRAFEQWIAQQAGVIYDD